ncbi:MAG: hypothetical protein WCK77_25420, partial [Verrucomicrobiota bacterium]
DENGKKLNLPLDQRAAIADLMPAVSLVELPAFVAADSIRNASACASDFLARLVDCFNLRRLPSGWGTSKQAIQKGEFGRFIRVATAGV